MSEADAGSMLVRSPLISSIPNLRHGFTTRCGGVSPAPWSSLNLGTGSGDDPARVRENWKRLLAELGTPEAPVWRLYQTHSDIVKQAPVAEGFRVGDDGLHCPGEGDGLVTTTPGAVMVAFTADCTPVLLAAGSPARGVAAIHAGWRGVASGVVVRAIESLVAATGVDVSEIRAAIGPAIGTCCFEVGEEVAQVFEDRFAPGTVERRPEWEKPHVALGKALRQQVGGAGVLLERFDAVGGCTRCQPEAFFSHRRDGTRRGSQAGVIAML